MKIDDNEYMAWISNGQGDPVMGLVEEPEDRKVIIGRQFGKTEAMRKLIEEGAVVVDGLAEAERKLWDEEKQRLFERLKAEEQPKQERKSNRAERRAKGDRRGFLGTGSAPHSPGNIGSRQVW